MKNSICENVELIICSLFNLYSMPKEHVYAGEFKYRHWCCIDSLCPFVAIICFVAVLSSCDVDNVEFIYQLEYSIHIYLSPRCDPCIFRYIQKSSLEICFRESFQNGHFSRRVNLLLVIMCNVSFV